MTMDITTQQRSDSTIVNQQQHDSNSKPDDYILAASPTNLKAATNHSATTTSLKRSFDVAFLMMPDEKLRQKSFNYQSMEKHLKVEETIDVESYPKDLSPGHNQAYIMMQNNLNCATDFFHNISNNNNNSNINHNSSAELRKLKRLTPISASTSPRIYDDPTIIPDIETTKSAFTKVHSQQRSSESPIPTPSISPSQLSCSSLSPPISTTPPMRPCSANQQSQPQHPQQQHSPQLTNNFYQHFRPEYQFNGAFQAVNQAHALALQNNRLKQHLLYRPMTPNNSPEMISNGGYLPSGGFPFSGAGANPFIPQPPEIIRHPAAAAVLTALIPPTLASTFTLTSQNVCAKCNISFRMTSDLVYHMRSHHKSESTVDPNRRKRQEKLKCPVCCESFRERHHLTRHMTAHQDKASDETVLHSSGGKSADKK